MSGDALLRVWAATVAQGTAWRPAGIFAASSSSSPNIRHSTQAR